MNRLLIGISLLGALALPLAVAPQVNAAPAPTGSIKSAKVTSFLTGLGDPRGLGFKDYKDGGLMVADSAMGAILDFALDGKQSLLAQANGLQGPTQIVYLPGGFYFAESKTGRVMQAKFNILAQVGDLINDPVGIVAAGRMDETPYVVSQSGKISHLLPLDNGATERAYVREYGWKTVYEPATPNTPDGIAPAIALDGDNILMTVPATGEVKLITNNGRSSVLAQGLGKPSCITTGEGGAFYVGDESNGGQLWRVDDNGEKSVVATGLGRPSAMVWGRPGTAYVADRNGNVWKLDWEK